MANPYYGVGGVPATQARGASATIRSEFVAVQTGFDSVQTAIAAVAGAGTTGTQLVLTATSGATPVKTIRSTAAGNLEFVNSAGTGVLVSITDAGQVTFSGSLIGNLTGNVSGTAASITGINPVATGGTGASTLAGILYGNGTSALTTATANQIVATIGVTSVANAGFATNSSQLNGQAASYYQAVGAAVTATTGTFSGDVTMLSQNGGPLAGMRSRIINGAMRVAQRSGATVTTALQYAGCDRHMVAIANGAGISAGNIVQSTSISGTSSGFTQLINAVTFTAGQPYFVHRIELANCNDLNSKTITISGKFYQDTGANQPLTIRLSKPTAAENFTVIANLYTNTANIAISGTTTSFSATFTLAGTDANNGLMVEVFLSNSIAVTSKNFALGDWQLEIGPVATPFEQRPISYELAACQRYYQMFRFDCGESASTAGGTSSKTATFMTQMRAVPTIVENFLAGGGVTSLTLAGFVGSVVAVITASTSTGWYRQSNYLLNAEL